MLQFSLCGTTETLPPVPTTVNAALTSLPGTKSVRSVALARSAGRTPESSDGSGLVSPGARRGRPLSESTHAKLLPELGVGAMTRGFRSSFRDYATKRTHMPHAVMGAALAHTNKAEAAYAPQRPVREAPYVDGVLGTVLDPLARSGLGT